MRTGKKILISIMSLLMTFSLTGCSILFPSKQETETQPVEEQLEIVEEEIIEEPVYSNEVKIEYDISNLPTPETVARRVETSYFSRKLLGSEVTNYNKILDGILNWQEEISLSECDEKTLIRIMNIILLDTTPAYNLDYTYSYTIREGSEKMVDKLYPTYKFSKEQFIESEDRINNLIRPYEELIMKSTTKIDALAKIIEVAENYIRQETDVFVSGSNGQEGRVLPLCDVFGAISHNSGNSDRSCSGINYLETAKLVNMLAHHSGIDSLVAMAHQDSPLSRGDFVKISKNEEDVRTATLDTDSFIFFNELLINGEWYIFSPKEQFEILKELNPSETGYYNIRLKVDASDSVYLLTTDRIYAGNHIFYPTDENLGILPNAHSLEFVYAYRNNDFIPLPNLKDPTDEQLKQYVDLFIQRLVEETSPKSMSESPTKVLRFESKELYDTYIEAFTEDVRKYSSESGRKIEDYTIDYYPELLMIILHDFYSY